MTRASAPAETNLFNGARGRHSVAGIFDYISVIAVTLFAVGLVGIMVYERSRARLVQEEAAGAADAGDAGDAGAAPEAAPGEGGSRGEGEGGGSGSGRRGDGGPGGSRGSGGRGGRRGRKRARA